MSEEGHNSRAAHEELEGFIKRVERLNDEKRLSAQQYNDAIKEVFKEAKGRGYDGPAMKEAMRLRAMTEDKRDMLRFYSDILGVFG
jgi:uncharacterized protein (UPF0335 family)